MAANPLGPEFDAFNELIKSKAGRERDNKLCNILASVLNERNKLKEQMSAVKDDGYVLVFGEDDLRKQAEEYKEQLKVLQIAIDTYKADFDMERKDRATARGDMEGLKVAKEQTDFQCRRLKEENRKLKEQLKLRRAESAGVPGNTDCLKCIELSQQVKVLSRQQKHFEREIEHAQMELVELNELRNHQKEKDAYTHRLEQQVKQLKSETALLNSNTWHSQSSGQLQFPQAVGGASGQLDPQMIAQLPFPVYKVIPNRPSPAQQVHPQHPSPHYGISKTFPRSQSNFDGHHSNDNGLPIRARDPHIQSYHSEGELQMSQRHAYDDSSHRNVTQSLGPAIGRQKEYFAQAERLARDAEFENAGYFRPGTVHNSRRISLTRSHSQQEPRRGRGDYKENSLTQSLNDPSAYHYYSGVSEYTDLHSRSFTGGGGSILAQSNFSFSTPDLRKCVSTHQEPLTTSEVYSNTPWNTHSQSNPPPIPPRVPIGAVSPHSERVSPYSANPLSSLYSRSSVTPKVHRSRRYPPIYENVDLTPPHHDQYSPQEGSAQYPSGHGERAVKPPIDTSGSQVWQDPNQHQQSQMRDPPMLPPKGLKPSPLRQHYDTPIFRQQQTDSPASIDGHSMMIPSNVNMSDSQLSSSSNAPPPLPPKLIAAKTAMDTDKFEPITAKTDTEELEHYMPPELNEFDEPNVSPRLSPKTSALFEGLTEEIASMISESETDSRWRQTNEQVPFDDNLECPVCHKKFRADQTLKCRDHVRECMNMKEERLREWNKMASGGTEKFSQQKSSNYLSNERPAKPVPRKRSFRKK